MVFFVSLTTSSGRLSAYAGKIILFQIKVFSGKIKYSVLARCMIKINARCCFKQWRIVRRINRFIKYWNSTYAAKI